MRTDKAVSKLRVWLEVLAMMHHGLAQVANRQHLLLVVCIIALRKGLDVDGRGLVQLLHAW